MTMASIAVEGIGPTTCLRIWGEMRCRSRRMLPEGWGWPGATIEWRLREYGHGAKEPGRSTDLTAPEQAVEDLHNDNTIAHWTVGVLSECTPAQRIAAHLRYVNGKCYADIAEQMSEDAPTTHEDVERMLDAVKVRMRRALRHLNQSAAA